jgi:hypothetical protein
MIRSIRVGWVASVVLAVLGLGVLAPNAAAAAAADTYTTTIHGGGAAFYYIVCLKTTTTVNKYPAGGGDRVCSGRKGSPDGSFDITAEYTSDDTVWVDFEMLVDLSGHSRTNDDIDITGAHSCTVSGALYAGKFECDSAVNKLTFTPPVIEPYTIDVNDPSEPVIKLLNLMAWCVSGAAVVGLLLTGMTLALQLRRGVAGEYSEYLQQLVIVFAACLMATTAGPVIEFLGFNQ